MLVDFILLSTVIGLVMPRWLATWATFLEWLFGELKKTYDLKQHMLGVYNGQNVRHLSRVLFRGKRVLSGSST